MLERAGALADLAVLRWLAPLALLHGLLFVVLVPPWQHYDEPAHFLYAAEIAAGELAAPGPASDHLRREIADSMYRFRFYPPDVRPDLLAPEPPALGFDQRLHPPLYYMLVALPLRGLGAWSVDQQLYAARLVSLALYLLTIITAWRVAVAMVPDEPLIQRLFPLLVLLSPAFADIMAAVNNDVLLNFSLTVVLLGAVLMIRHGLRPVPLALIFVGMIVALLTKRTALVAAVPLGFAFVWAFLRMPLRWWVMPLIGIAGVTLIGVATLQTTVVDGPSGPHTVLSARPWFVAFDTSYLRLYADLTIRSISDPTLIGDRYRALTIIAFSGLYTHFAWGQVTMPPAWIWALAALSLAATVGLLVGGVRTRRTLPLWQRRCLWLFLITVVVAWMSLFVRIHPLPPPEVVIYIPRARYIYWTMVPHLWLLALGLVWIAPAKWRPYVPVALVAFFACLDLGALMWAIVPHYYH